MAIVEKIPANKQLTLSVGLKDEATFANYFSLQNVELVQALKRAASGAGEKLIYLYGCVGLGRSHLAQACCHYANSFGRSSIYLPLANLVSYPSSLLEGLENLSLVCVDDFHALAGKPLWEEAF